MPTLHLGVLDVQYSAPDTSPARTSAQKRNQKRNDVRAAFGLPEHLGTTGDIAEILEDRYRVMGNFFDAHSEEIVGFLEESIGDALEDMLSGAPIGGNSMAAATGQIQDLFVKFIDSGEMEAGEFVGGVPTQAALRGVNHRLKHPYAKGNPRRPSFKDTGLYENSFRAWIDE